MAWLNQIPVWSLKFRNHGNLGQMVTVQWKVTIHGKPSVSESNRKSPSGSKIGKTLVPGEELWQLPPEKKNKQKT